ncbi:unnamed protein product [Trypanosoma congolense IL3000]|uniref:WGS project CAEQ00000000 data, annotated contig 2027 n=1 Tax=Trypanosoma congolense (strain IL3000) TaxID=1068625 RepID=F9WAX4_TRYCI|nr:unnamed protein product [Trypanosoma congolense IL3000]
MHCSPSPKIEVTTHRAATQPRHPRIHWLRRVVSLPLSMSLRDWTVGPTNAVFLFPLIHLPATAHNRRPIIPTPWKVCFPLSADTLVRLLLEHLIPQSESHCSVPKTCTLYICVPVIMLPSTNVLLKPGKVFSAPSGCLLLWWLVLPCVLCPRLVASRSQVAARSRPLNSASRNPSAGRSAGIQCCRAVSKAPSVTSACAWCR